MRSTAIQYVGINVHQATLVCGFKDETGPTTIESKVATRREAIESFVRGLDGQEARVMQGRGDLTFRTVTA
jgi:hypothetical protein